MARRQRNEGSASWAELFMFVLIIACIYSLLALFDSSLAGEGGREWGKYLRKNWGGAVIVLLLFWMYVCGARFMRLRIPRLPRQILGTLMLYVSLAFMLGFLRETGWESEATLFQPGSFGSGLAKFFVLNIGTFITLLLVAGSFVLSAVLYGSRILKLTIPQVPSFRFRRRRPKPRRRQRRYNDYESYSEERPEDILFMKNIPAPAFKDDDDYYDDEEDSAQITDIEPIDTSSKRVVNFEPPYLGPVDDDIPAKPKTGQKALDIIDDALALIDAGTSAPPARKTSKTSRTRKIRRPFPEIKFTEEEAPKSQRPAKKKHDDAVFPPPAELFGERSRIEFSRNPDRDYGKHGRAIISTLKNFGISASVAQTIAGPSLIQYKLELASGTKISKVSGLDDEIAIDLAVTSVRIEAPILGTHYVGVEVPIPDRKTVTLRSIIDSGEYINTSARLPLPLGMKTGGKVFVKGLEEMPHMLVAGSEGSGKSTFVNACILSMCSVKTPDELKLILIDPRHSDFSVYDGLPHLLAEPVTDPKTARKAVEWACAEMDRRTAEFSQEKARNLEAYNRKVSKSKRIPEIAIVISELADLMYSEGSDFGELAAKLARKSGGAGIYMLIAAQKPSVDVFTPQMKSVVPARAVFTLNNAGDSKNAIDSPDGAKLIGKGDMLFVSTGSPVPVRLQSPYVKHEKIADFVEYMTSSLEPPELIKF
ncbi:MAG: hypothetical protein IJR85_00550 [Synergistaceae bacterium]|nr:hypothetical protein [Synergistaceae bacterium]